MSELDFKERERLGREHLAERLKRLRATLATPEARRRRPPPPAALTAPEGEPPTFWWQR
ncbi:MAG TPA: hypothetical protein VMK42_04235 [Anaeromyxobacteraceae bacterium]|nr:hypothetical protein [Anaeromyxobacteraceae bacterium]